MAIANLTDWGLTLYTSAVNLSASGNSGVLAFPTRFQTQAHYPILFEIVGNNMATDETNTVTMSLFTDATGSKAATVTQAPTITFTQLTATVIYVSEVWPGDLTNAGAQTACPPWFQLNWALGGTTKSMGFTLYGSFWHLDGF
jgi:hypothetical protein